MGRSKYFIFALLIWAGSVASSYGQQVCISQETANKCAEAVATADAQAKEIEALRTALTNRDKIIEDLKVKVAVEAQRATDNEAQILRMTAVLEGLLKAYTKPKKWGIIVF